MAHDLIWNLNVSVRIALIEQRKWIFQTFVPLDLIMWYVCWLLIYVMII